MLRPVPLSTAPKTYQEAVKQYQDVGNALIESGSQQPFVWPYRALGPYLLIFYLLLPPTQSRIVFYLRYPLFALIVYLSVEAIVECKSQWVAYGYLIGLIHGWTMLWSATLLIFRDARSEGRRIEGRGDSNGGGKSGSGEAAGEEKTSASSSAVRSENGEVKNVRFRSDGSSDTNSTSALQSVPAAADSSTSRVRGTEKYVWQGLPLRFWHRLDWVLELGSSFRGARWEHAISGLIPPPAEIQASLKESRFPNPTNESSLTRRDLLRIYLPQLVLGYFIQDGLKYLAMRDPYFWSLPFSSASPFPWPRASRTLISVVFTYFSLKNIFLLAPLGYGVVLGPERIGEFAWPWLYTPYFGSLTDISRKGLAGAWGKWWHQLFRMAFEQAGEYVGGIAGWDKKTSKGVMLRVMIAFTCSGILHFCGSFTTASLTKPWMPFLFFCIQPLGIFGQRALSEWLKSNGWRDRIPSVLRQVGNIFAVLVWFYFTGPLVADDFAACSVWLYEPVPVSFIQGLRGQGWWRLGGSWFRLHTADQWWKSGIAF